MKIGKARDFWAGAMFLVVGLAFVALARSYDLGTAQRMGPAYFPSVLGVALALLGLVLVVRGLRAGVVAQPIERFHLRPLASVLGAVAAFGLLLRPAGLAIALTVLIVGASFGAGRMPLRTLLSTWLVLVTLVLLVFHWGLGLAIPIWPEFLARG